MAPLEFCLVFALCHLAIKQSVIKHGDKKELLFFPIEIQSPHFLVAKLLIKFDRDSLNESRRKRDMLCLEKIASFHIKTKANFSPDTIIMQSIMEMSYCKRSSRKLRISRVKCYSKNQFGAFATSV